MTPGRLVGKAGGMMRPCRPYKLRPKDRAMRYAIAVDGGGSKTDAVVIDETGTVSGWGRGGSAHSLYTSPEAIRAALETALRQALGDIRDGEFWTSGIGGRGYDHYGGSALIAEYGTIRGHAPSGETHMAFAAAQKEWGMVVLSGTGSFVFGLTADGQTRHFGGMGPILGDYGSAHAIGLYGLRAAFASRWTESRRTTLEQAIPAAYGLPDLRALFDRTYGPGLSRREIAAAARVVDAEAEAGDRVAQGCLLGAADELVALAFDVVSELQLQEIEFPLIGVGSVATGSRLWWQRLCERVREVAPGAQPILPRVRPVVGGALLALKEMGVAWTPELVDRIVATQEPHLQAIEAREAEQTI
jgi:N-acetylglucosamine kinase-like BadF-type ATPase